MKFFDPAWQAMFKHTVAEAKRLWQEINANNGPGYYSSGGRGPACCPAGESYPDPRFRDEGAPLEELDCLPAHAERHVGRRIA